MTADVPSTSTATDFSLMMPSSHAVSMVFSLKASVSSSSPRYSTVVRISPMMKSSLSALTRFLRATSRVGPEAKRWPNCESAYSCTPPSAVTEK